MLKLYESHMSQFTRNFTENKPSEGHMSWSETIKGLSTKPPGSGKMLKKLPHLGSSDLMTPCLVFKTSYKGSECRTEVNRY